MTVHKPLRTQVRQALSVAGDDGLTLQDLERITGENRKKVQTALGHLGDNGEKWSAVQGKNEWRHFGTEDQRDRWRAAAGRRVALSELERKTLKTNALKREAAHKAPPLGAESGQPVVKIARRAVGAMAEGEPIIPDGLKVQTCYSPAATAKWQLLPEAPDERWPRFAGTPPGMDPSTGREWGR